MTLNCPHCSHRVIAQPGEHCPKCFRRIPAGEEGEKSGSNGQPTGKATLRSLMAGRALGGIFIGLALALLALVGGSYQRRGVGYVVSGGELVWVGLVVAAIAAVLYLVLRARRD